MKFVAVGALAAGLVFGQVNHRHHKMMQSLNLTDVQKQQAKTIFQQSRQSVQPVAQELKQNREALASAVKANDTAAIEKLSATQGQLRGRMMAARAEAMAKVYQILTPEQRAKAEQMRQTVKSRMAQRHNGVG
ncbi:MAG TPA: Spy/CpxP family protein refolding chaperone [Candidatus Sulfopaludibacter sp.]|nr:Spy/CpxP family protein refolding chaperone [Candidatus Sulfopaludibacter sp.]